jgi:hypothetical protein
MLMVGLGAMEGLPLVPSCLLGDAVKERCWVDPVILGQRRCGKQAYADFVMDAIETSDGRANRGSGN